MLPCLWITLKGGPNPRTLYKNGKECGTRNGLRRRKYNTRLRTGDSKRPGGPAFQGLDESQFEPLAFRITKYFADSVTNRRRNSLSSMGFFATFPNRLSPRQTRKCASLFSITCAQQHCVNPCATQPYAKYPGIPPWRQYSVTLSDPRAAVARRNLVAAPVGSAALHPCTNWSTIRHQDRAALRPQRSWRHT